MLDPTGLILNCAVNNKFQRPGIDSLSVISEIVSPENQEVDVKAIVESFDFSTSDTVSMFDDGLHKDSLSNDGIFGGQWLANQSEDNFNVHITASLLDDDRTVILDDAQYFTTKGPVVLENFEITSNDTVAFPGERLKYSFTIKNMGISDTVFNADVNLSIADTSITDVTFIHPEFGDIAPGESVTSTKSFAIKFQDYCAPGIYDIELEINSNDVHYWSDYLVVVVVENPTSVEDLSNLPSEFMLQQNYPNPFNPTTTIRYSIPSSVISNPKWDERSPINNEISPPTSWVRNDKMNVELIVYDILGRQIAILINEKQKPGYYEVDFDGTELTSGIYFYTLKSDILAETKKMLLLK